MLWEWGGVRATCPESGWTQGHPGPRLAENGEVGTDQMLSNRPSTALRAPPRETRPSFLMECPVSGSRAAPQSLMRSGMCKKTFQVEKCRCREVFTQRHSIDV